MVQSSTTRSERPVPGAPVSGRAWLMLAMATVGFAVNFWAWALPPLVMGSLYGAYGTYGAGLALLAVVAAAALAYTLTGVRAAAEGGEHTPRTDRPGGHHTAHTTA
ncbi:hypothetical protein [Streptomyces sp. NPDC001508]|uniref:hypothetical protein n=1 Tax=Streptomyces sp. NPDC001508 TaxID=3154656 RepID=UPI003317BCB2